MCGVFHNNMTEKVLNVCLIRSVLIHYFRINKLI